MNQVLLSLLALAGKAGIAAITSLLTENFIKHAVVISLQKIVNRTATDYDNKLLQSMREEWRIPEEKAVDKI